MIDLRSGRTSRYRRGDAMAGWLFSAPAMLFLSVFLVLPFAMAVWFSLTNQRLIPNLAIPTEFIGLENYARLFSDDAFLQAVGNNLYFTLVVVPVQTALALGLALLINRRMRGMQAFRTIFFSPVVTSMVVVSIVWYLLFNPGAGFVNRLISFFSFGSAEPIAWLQDTNWAMPAIMIVSVWQGAGFQMIIFLAGLQDIPKELYEAAIIDGASGWTSFRRVTLPLLRHTMLFVIISTTILSFKLFQQVWIMTQGGPQNATMTVIVHLYRSGFRQLRVGYAAAIGVVFFLAVLLISIAQRKALGRR